MYRTGNGTELQDYIINFAYYLHPNGPRFPAWPRYKLASLELLTLWDWATPINVTQDIYVQCDNIGGAHCDQPQVLLITDL